MDSRIKIYTQAIQDLKEGEFISDLPLDSSDEEVAKLGKELLSLSKNLRNKYEEMWQLNKITEKVNQGILLDDVLSYIYDVFYRIIPYNRIGVALLDDQKEWLTAYWLKTDKKDIYIKKGFKAKMEGSSLQTIIDSGQPRIINDLEAYLAKKPESESTRLAVKEGIQSSLTCPMIAMGNQIGFIFFSCWEKDVYRNMHIDLYQQLVSQISMIVEKSLIYEQLLDLHTFKNKFMGMVVHDLRSPLMVIRSYIELFQSGYLNQEKKPEKAFNAMDSSCKVMVDLINELMDLNEVENVKLDFNIKLQSFEDVILKQLEIHSILAQQKEIIIIKKFPKYIPHLPICQKNEWGRHLPMF